MSSRSGVNLVSVSRCDGGWPLKLAQYAATAFCWSSRCALASGRVVICASLSGLPGRGGRGGRNALPVPMATGGCPSQCSVTGTCNRPGSRWLWAFTCSFWAGWLATPAARVGRKAGPILVKAGPHPEPGRCAGGQAPSARAIRWGGQLAPVGGSPVCPASGPRNVSVASVSCRYPSLHLSQSTGGAAILAHAARPVFLESAVFYRFWQPFAPSGAKTCPDPALAPAHSGWVTGRAKLLCRAPVTRKLGQTSPTPYPTPGPTTATGAQLNPISAMLSPTPPRSFGSSRR